eukprot:1003544-Prorocentrum_minimum.AAC.1
MDHRVGLELKFRKSTFIKFTILSKAKGKIESNRIEFKIRFDSGLNLRNLSDDSEDSRKAVTILSKNART